MAQIQTFNSRTRDAFQAAMAKACGELEERFGVKIEANGYRYDPTGASFEPKFTVVVKNEDGSFHNPEADEFERHAEFYGLKPDDLGKTFVTKRGRYKITGLNINRPKYPISATSLRDGKAFKFPAALVKFGLQR